MTDFFSFKRLICQNKDEIKKIYKKYKGKEILDLLEMVPYDIILFRFIFGFDIDYGLTLLLIKIYPNKLKDLK